MKAIKSLYEMSNEITSVKYNSFDKKYMKRLMLCDTLASRLSVGQSLLNYLCDKYKIGRCQLIVMEQNRQKRGRTEVHGFYRAGLFQIVIYNKTAVKGNQISIKTFIDTLLHEFNHHYDMEVLKFANSPHTAGFYKRISDLHNKLS